jgi:predicted dehydrogenase
MDENRKMMFYPKEGDPYEVQVKEKPLYLGEIEDMHSAILDETQNLISLEESRNHIKTVIALYKSAITKLAVPIT